MDETEKTTLEIRHQVFLDGPDYIVREQFGNCAKAEFRCPDRATADALIEERRTMLTEMVAAVSDKARKAVVEARYIDNLKAGHG
jgi:hypothetical protein